MRPTPLSHDLDPWACLAICGCHSGSLMLASYHPPKQIKPPLFRQGGRHRRDTGVEEELEADHVIAATGYRVDLTRLGFFSPRMLAQIRTVEHTPVLSSHFETSLHGLFFIGPAAANSFGPLLRFACGNRFVSRRLAPYIARRA